MPSVRRYFQPGQLQFVTSSTYHGVKLFESERFRSDFVEVLNQLRQEMRFLLIGWVLMPEHSHLLIKPDPTDLTPSERRANALRQPNTTSLILQEFKRQTAFRIITTLRENSQLKLYRDPPRAHQSGVCWRLRLW